MARKYFAKAIEYNANSLRALYGLLLVRRGWCGLCYESLTTQPPTSHQCLRMGQAKQRAVQQRADDEAWTLRDLEKAVQEKILTALEAAPPHVKALAGATLELSSSS